jgi:hypothetical protein
MTKQNKSYQEQLLPEVKAYYEWLKKRLSNTKPVNKQKRFTAKDFSYGME